MKTCVLRQRTCSGAISPRRFLSWIFFGRDAFLKELALNEANLNTLVGIPVLIQSKRKRRRRGKNQQEKEDKDEKKGKMKTKALHDVAQ